MATEAGISEVLLPTKGEAEAVCLTAAQLEKTVIETLAVELKLNELRETEDKQLESSTQVEITKNVVRSNNPGTLEDASFLASLSGPAVSTEEASGPEDCRVDKLDPLKTVIPENAKNPENVQHAGVLDEIVYEVNQNGKTHDVLNTINRDGSEVAKSGEPKSEVKVDEATKNEISLDRNVEVILKDEKQGKMEESYTKPSGEAISSVDEEACTHVQSVEETSTGKGATLSEEYTQERSSEEIKEDKCVDVVTEEKVSKEDTETEKEKDQITQDRIDDVSNSTISSSQESRSNETSDTKKDDPESITISTKEGYIQNLEESLKEKEKEEETISVPPVKGNEGNEVSSEEIVNIESIETELPKNESGDLPAVRLLVEQAEVLNGNNDDVSELESHEDVTKESNKEVLEELEIADVSDSTQCEPKKEIESTADESLQKQEEDKPLKPIEASIEETKVAISEEEVLESRDEDAVHSQEITEGDVDKEHTIEREITSSLPESIQEEKDKSSQDNKKEAEKSNEQESYGEIIQEAGVKELSPEASREVAIETFKGHANEAETSKEEAIEESIPGETTKDVEMIVDASQVKQEEVRQEGKDAGPINSLVEDNNGENESHGQNTGVDFDKEQTTAEVTVSAPELVQEETSSNSQDNIKDEEKTSEESTAEITEESSKNYVPTETIQDVIEESEDHEKEVESSKEKAVEELEIVGQGENIPCETEKDVESSIHALSAKQEDGLEEVKHQDPTEVLVEENKVGDKALKSGGEVENNERSIEVDFEKEEIVEEVALSAPDSTQEETSNNTQDKVNCKEKAHEEIIEEESASQLSQENTQEDAIEKLKDHENETEKCEDKAVPELEEVEEGNCIPRETNKDIAGSVDTLLVKQEEDQQQEVQYVEPIKDSVEESKVEVLEEVVSNQSNIDDNHEQIADFDKEQTTEEETKKIPQDKLETEEIKEESKIVSINEEATEKLEKDHEAEAEKCKEEVAQVFETPKANESSPKEIDKEAEHSVDASLEKQEEAKLQDRVENSIENIAEDTASVEVVKDVDENPDKVTEKGIEVASKTEGNQQAEHEKKEERVEELPQVTPEKHEAQSSENATCVEVEGNIPKLEETSEREKAENMDYTTDLKKEITEVETTEASESIQYKTSEDALEKSVVAPSEKQEDEKEENKGEDSKQASGVENKVEDTDVMKEDDENEVTEKGIDVSNKGEEVSLQTTKEAESGEKLETSVLVTPKETETEPSSENSSSYSVEVEGNAENLEEISETGKEEKTTEKIDNANDSEEVVQELKTAEAEESISRDANKDVESSTDPSSEKQEEGQYIDPAKVLIEEKKVEDTLSAEVAEDDRDSKVEVTEKTTEEEATGKEDDRAKQIDEPGEKLEDLPQVIPEETETEAKETIENIEEASETETKEEKTEEIHEVNDSEKEVVRELETGVDENTLHETDKDVESYVEPSLEKQEEDQCTEPAEILTEEKKVEGTLSTEVVQDKHDSKDGVAERTIEVVDEGKEVEEHTTQKDKPGEKLEDLVQVTPESENAETSAYNEVEETIENVEKSSEKKEESQSLEAIKVLTEEKIAEDTLLVEKVEDDQDNKAEATESTADAEKEGDKDEIQAIQKDEPGVKLEDLNQVALEETETEQASENTGTSATKEVVETIENLEKSSEKQEESQNLEAIKVLTEEKIAEDTLLVEKVEDDRDNKAEATESTADEEKEGDKDEIQAIQKDEPEVKLEDLNQVALEETETEHASENAGTSATEEVVETIENLETSSEKQEESQYLEPIEALPKEKKVEDTLLTEKVKDDHDSNVEAAERTIDVAKEGDKDEILPKDESGEKLENLVQEKAEETETKPASENAGTSTCKEVEETVDNLEDTSETAKKEKFDTNESEKEVDQETTAISEDISYDTNKKVESYGDHSSEKKEDQYLEPARVLEKKAEDTLSAEVVKGDNENKVEATERTIDIVAKDEEDEKQAAEENKPEEKLENLVQVTPEETETETESTNENAGSSTCEEVEGTNRIEGTSEAENKEEYTKNVDDAIDSEKEVTETSSGDQEITEEVSREIDFTEEYHQKGTDTETTEDTKEPQVITEPSSLLQEESVEEISKELVKEEGTQSKEQEQSEATDSVEETKPESLAENAKQNEDLHSTETTEALEKEKDLEKSDYDVTVEEKEFAPDADVHAQSREVLAADLSGEICEKPSSLLQEESVEKISKELVKEEGTQSKEQEQTEVTHSVEETKPESLAENAKQNEDLHSTETTEAVEKEKDLEKSDYDVAVEEKDLAPDADVHAQSREVLAADLSGEICEKPSSLLQEESVEEISKELVKKEEGTQSKEQGQSEVTDSVEETKPESLADNAKQNEDLHSTETTEAVEKEKDLEKSDYDVAMEEKDLAPDADVHAQSREVLAADLSGEICEKPSSLLQEESVEEISKELVKKEEGTQSKEQGQSEVTDSAEETKPESLEENAKQSEDLHSTETTEAVEKEKDLEKSDYDVAVEEKHLAPDADVHAQSREVLAADLSGEICEKPSSLLQEESVEEISKELVKEEGTQSKEQGQSEVTDSVEETKPESLADNAKQNEDLHSTETTEAVEKEKDLEKSDYDVAVEEKDLAPDADVHAQSREVLAADLSGEICEKPSSLLQEESVEEISKELVKKEEGTQSKEQGQSEVTDSAEETKPESLEENAKQSEDLHSTETTEAVEKEKDLEKSDYDVAVEEKHLAPDADVHAQSREVLAADLSGEICEKPSSLLQEESVEEISKELVKKEVGTQSKEQEQTEVTDSAKETKPESLEENAKQNEDLHSTETTEAVEKEKDLENSDYDVAVEDKDLAPDADVHAQSREVLAADLSGEICEKPSSLLQEESVEEISKELVKKEVGTQSKEQEQSEVTDSAEETKPESLEENAKQNEDLHSTETTKAVEKEKDLEKSDYDVAVEEKDLAPDADVHAQSSEVLAADLSGEICKKQLESSDIAPEDKSLESSVEDVEAQSGDVSTETVGEEASLKEVEKVIEEQVEPGLKEVKPDEEEKTRSFEAAGEEKDLSSIVNTGLQSDSVSTEISSGETSLKETEQENEERVRSYDIASEDKGVASSVDVDVHSDSLSGEVEREETCLQEDKPTDEEQIKSLDIGSQSDTAPTGNLSEGSRVKEPEQAIEEHVRSYDAASEEKGLASSLDADVTSDSISATSPSEETSLKEEEPINEEQVKSDDIAPEEKGRAREVISDSVPTETASSETCAEAKQDDDRVNTSHEAPEEKSLLSSIDTDVQSNFLSSEVVSEEAVLKEDKPAVEEKIKSFDTGSYSETAPTGPLSDEVRLKEPEPDSEEQVRSYDTTSEEKGATCSLDVDAPSDSILTTLPSEETSLKEVERSNEEPIKSDDVSPEEKGLDSEVIFDSVATEAETFVPEAEQDDDQVKTSDVAPEEKSLPSSVETDVQCESASTSLKEVKADIEQQADPKATDSILTTLPSEETSLKEVELSHEEQINSDDISSEEKGLDSEVKFDSVATETETFVPEAKQDDDQVKTSDVAPEEKSLPSSVETDVQCESAPTSLKEVKADTEQQADPKATDFILTTLPIKETSLKEVELSNEEQINSDDISPEEKGLDSEVKLDSVATETETFVPKAKQDDDHVKTSGAAPEEKSLPSSLETDVQCESVSTILNEVKADTEQQADPKSTELPSEEPNVEKAKQDHEEQVGSPDIAPEDAILVRNVDIDIQSSSALDEVILKENKPIYKEQVEYSDIVEGEVVESNVDGDEEQRETLKPEDDKENKALEAAGECEEKTKQETTDESPIARPDSQQKEIVAETPLHDSSEENLKDNSSVPSTEQELETTEASERSDETTAPDNSQCEDKNILVIEPTKDEEELKQGDSKVESNDTDKEIVNEETQELNKQPEIITSDAIPTEVHGGVEEVVGSGGESITRFQPTSTGTETVIEEKYSSQILTEVKETDSNEQTSESLAKEYAAEKNEESVPMVAEPKEENLPVDVSIATTEERKIEEQIGWEVENKGDNVDASVGDKKAVTSFEEAQLIEEPLKPVDKPESVTLEERSFDVVSEQPAEQEDTERENIVPEKRSVDEVEEAKLASNTERIDATSPIPAVELKETDEETKEASEQVPGDEISKEQPQAPSSTLLPEKLDCETTTVETKQDPAEEVGYQDEESREPKLYEAAEERQGKDGTEEDSSTAHEQVLESSYESSQRVSKDEVVIDRDLPVGISTEPIQVSSSTLVPEKSEFETASIVQTEEEQEDNTKKNEILDDKKIKETLETGVAEETKVKEEPEEDINVVPVTESNYNAAIVEVATEGENIENLDSQSFSLEEQNDGTVVEQIVEDTKTKVAIPDNEMRDYSETAATDETCFQKEEIKEVKVLEEDGVEIKDTGKPVSDTDSQSAQVAPEERTIICETFPEKPSEVHLVEQSGESLPTEQDGGTKSPAKEDEEKERSKEVEILGYENKETYSETTTDETPLTKEEPTEIKESASTLEALGADIVEDISESSEALSRETPETEVFSRDISTYQDVQTDNNEIITENVATVEKMEKEDKEEAKSSDKDMCLDKEEPKKLELSEPGINSSDGAHEGQKEVLEVEARKADSPTEQDKATETRETRDFVSDKVESPEPITSIEDVEIIEDHLNIATADLRTREFQFEKKIEAEEVTEKETCKEELSTETGQEKSSLDTEEVHEISREIKQPEEIRSTTCTEKTPLEAQTQVTTRGVEDPTELAEPTEEADKEHKDEKESKSELVSLSDLMQSSDHPTEGTEEPKKKKEAKNEKAKTDEEKDDDEEEEEDEDHEESEHPDAPILVQSSKDVDAKASRKKSHGLFSGVGSKVKHSISKVKKAITGKSSNSKTQPSST